MDDGEVGLVDFGFFHQLSPEFREFLKGETTSFKLLLVPVGREVIRGR